MSHLSIPEPGDGYAANPIVQLAVRELRREWLGDQKDLTREVAARLLPEWEHYSELSPREVAAILARFEATR